MTDLYRNGLRSLNPTWWDSEPQLGLLLIDADGGSAFDVEDLVVADLVGELDVDDYERQSVTVSAPTWDAGGSLWLLPSSGVSFGHLGDGVPEDPTVGAVVLFEDLGDDSQSLLLAYQATSTQLDSTELLVPVPTALAVVRQGAP